MLGTQQDRSAVTYCAPVSQDIALIVPLSLIYDSDNPTTTITITEVGAVKIGHG